jgi:hypothetical protein
VSVGGLADEVGHTLGCFWVGQRTRLGN